MKLYRQRSAWSFVRSRFTGFRAEREYLRLAHLCSCHIPCTVPLGWGWGVNAEHGRHEYLVMEELEGVIQLKAWLTSTRPSAGELAPLFQLCRRMHEAGVCSQTLYDYNVLVRPEALPESRYFLSDFPRSFVFPGDLSGTRPAVLDLLDLHADLVDDGVRAEDELILAYGLEGAGLRFWRRMRKAAVDPREKGIRLRRDLRLRVKWAWAWALTASVARSRSLAGSGKLVPPRLPRGH